MNKSTFYQWLPSIFIGVGILLWGYSLGFSSIANPSERNLAEDWKTRFKEGIEIADSINNETIIGLEVATVNRPYDRIFLEAANEVLALQVKTFRLLDEKLKARDLSIDTLLADFQTKNQQLLEDISEKSPIISRSEVEEVLAQCQFVKPIKTSDEALFFYIQKQQVINASTLIIHYFTSKVGGRMHCCWRSITPLISFGSNVLKKGETTQLKVFLSDNPCPSNSIAFNHQYTIKGAVQIVGLRNV